MFLRLRVISNPSFSALRNGDKCFILGVYRYFHVKAVLVTFVYFLVTVWNSP